MKNNNTFWKVAKVFILITSLLFFVIPIVYLFIMSLKSPDDVLSKSILPDRLAWGNWLFAIKESPTFLYLKNSLFVGIFGTFVALVIAIPANYVLARLNFGGKKIITLIATSYIAPPVLAIIPIFVLFKKLHLINSLIGLGLMEGFIMSAIAILLLDSFFRSIPHSLDEAAKIDGCGKLTILFKIIIPLAMPGIIAVGIICFILIYNDFLIPLMLLYSKENLTLPIGISLLQGGREVMFGQMAASTLMGMIPVYCLALFLQKWLISGLTHGSNK